MCKKNPIFSKLQLLNVSKRENVFYAIAITSRLTGAFHRFFLLFSSGFSASLPQVPIQVLAVTGSASGASVVFHSNVAASLLADGTNLASKLCAKFQTTSTQFQHQGNGASFCSVVSGFKFSQMHCVCPMKDWKRKSRLRKRFSARSI